MPDTYKIDNVRLRKVDGPCPRLLLLNRYDWNNTPKYGWVCPPGCLRVVDEPYMLFRPGWSIRNNDDTGPLWHAEDERSLDLLIAHAGLSDEDADGARLLFALTGSWIEAAAAAMERAGLHPFAFPAEMYDL